MLSAFLLLLAAQPAPTLPPPAATSLVSIAPAPLATLQHQLDTLAALPSGDFGIAVLDLKDGRSVSVNGDRLFPMASTVKLAIAATFLSDVDTGRRSLADLVPTGTATLPAATLIERMIERSDNRATDILLAHLGGPPAIQAWIERHRLAGLRIDRTIAELLAARRARSATAPGLEGLLTANDNSPLSFDNDPRDSATPLAFADFLRRLHGSELLKPASRDWLFSVMARCITGTNRIPGMLPKGTPVEHKTGTYSTITSDVGYINLPNGRRIIVAAFARGGANRASLIARASRAIYDAFATTP